MSLTFFQENSEDEVNISYKMRKWISMTVYNGRSPKETNREDEKRARS